MSTTVTRPYTGIVLRHLIEDERLPDDIAQALQQRYGPEWWDRLGAYESLAAVKGIPLLTVLRHAADDTLGDLIRRTGR